jgi:hypothetical protein
MSKTIGNPLTYSQGGALNGAKFARLLKRWGNSFRHNVCLGLFLGIALLPPTTCGQSDNGQDTLPRISPARRLGTVVGGGAIIAGTLISLDRAWYSQYDRGRFHMFNDGGEWLQMDKVGHSFATYTVGAWGHRLMRWCGYPEKTSVWIGGSVGLAYLTAVECMDGTSEEWGFSAWDMTANVAGTGLFIGQHLAWKEQRITFKYSAHLTDYAPQRPNVLGEGLSERILKDYNAFGSRGLPAWLNLAAGYGAEGMLYADANPFQHRQFYLAPDIDLTRIPTKSKLLRTVLFTLNCVKVPMPALEFNGNGTVKAYALYF